MSRPEPPTQNESSLYVQSRRWITSKPVQAYLTKLKADKIAQSAAERERIGTEGNEARTKDDHIRELNRLITKALAEGDDKTYLETVKTLNTLQQLNKEQEEGKEQLTHYYLPLRCHYCLLYKADKVAKSQQLQLTS